MSQSVRTRNKIAVALATHNGERFLSAQLESLRNQTHERIDVWASDDGSTDGTMPLLEEARAGWSKGRFTILQGPGQGFAENFRSLILNEDIVADAYCFCDQDDLWDPDKIATGLEWLETIQPGLPGLYCSRTRTLDEEGRPIGLSPLFARPPSFRNAIVQSIAGANTMVMNHPAWAALRRASAKTVMVSHDWWAYIVVTGVGGRVHYSPDAHIGYRQHGHNLVGSNNSVAARLRRYGFLMRSGFSGWMAQNLEGLRSNEELLTGDARAVLAELERVHRGGLIARMSALARSGAYRQSGTANIGLYLACLLGKL